MPEQQGSWLVDTGRSLPRRTADRLWADLVAGRARVRDRLPSERALARRYGVSRVTVRLALGALAERGLVSVAPARGWSLEVETGPVGEDVGHVVQGFADYAAERGLRARSAVLHQSTRPATPAESDQLQMPSGSTLFVMRRLRFLDDVVVAVETNRLPLSLCPALTTTDFHHESLYATLRRADPPQLPRVADYFVEARHPEGEERALLEIEGDVPLLVAEQLTYNQLGRALEWTTQAFRGDRYRFRASITN